LFRAKLTQHVVTDYLLNHQFHMLCHAQLKFPDRLPVATNVQYYNQLIASFVLIEKPMYTIY